MFKVSSFLRQVGNSAGVLTREGHEFLAYHPDVEVRRAHAGHRGAPKDLAMRRLSEEPDSDAAGAWSKAFPLEALGYFIRHRRFDAFASAAAQRRLASLTAEQRSGILSDLRAALGAGFKHFLDHNFVNLLPLVAGEDDKVLVIESAHPDVMSSKEFIQLVDSPRTREAFLRRLVSFTPNERSAWLWLNASRVLDPGGLRTSSALRAVNRFPDKLMRPEKRDALIWWLEPFEPEVPGSYLKDLIRLHENRVEARKPKPVIGEASSFEEVLGWFAHPEGSQAARKWVDKQRSLTVAEAARMLEAVKASPNIHSSYVIFSILAKVDVRSLINEFPELAVQFERELFNNGNSLKDLGGLPAKMVVDKFTDPSAVFTALLEANAGSFETVEVLLGSFTGSFDEFLLVVSNLGPEK